MLLDREFSGTCSGPTEAEISNCYLRTVQRRSTKHAIRLKLIAVGSIKLLKEGTTKVVSVVFSAPEGRKWLWPTATASCLCTSHPTFSALHIHTAMVSACLVERTLAEVTRWSRQIIFSSCYCDQYFPTEHSVVHVILAFTPKLIPNNETFVNKDKIFRNYYIL